ncbi:MAG: hypothetical protein ABI303_02325 [Candidatus Saccharimonas sp.]
MVESIKCFNLALPRTKIADIAADKLPLADSSGVFVELFYNHKPLCTLRESYIHIALDIPSERPAPQGEINGYQQYTN